MKNYFKILFAALLCLVAFVSCQPSEQTPVKIEPTEKVELTPVQDTIYESVQEYNHTSQNEPTTHNRNIGFGILFIAMAAGTSVSIRTNFFQSIWVGFIFEAAEKIAKQFLDKLNYDFMILFTICKKIILALVDKDPNNIEQIKLIFEEHGDDLMDFLFKFLSDRLLAKLAKNVNLSETNKQLAMAQPEMMRLTYENAEHSDFSEVLANTLLEKKSQYPNLSNLTNPTV